MADKRELQEEREAVNALNQARQDAFGEAQKAAEEAVEKAAQKKLK